MRMGMGIDLRGVQSNQTGTDINKALRGKGGVWILL